jgi:hypothetical protein
MRGTLQWLCFHNAERMSADGRLVQAVAIAALDSATKEFNGDSQRTYLTGISVVVTGHGRWLPISRRFAL